MPSLRSLPLIRKKTEPSDAFTVLDIGTAVVKALVIKREGSQGVVVGASKVEQKQNDMQAGAVSNIQSVIDTCDRALTEAEDMCEQIPSQVVIGIAGEQVYGKLTTVAFPRQQPTAKITSGELASALELVQRRALREAVKEMSHAIGVTEVNVKLVHSVITNIEVDGHSVSSPIDFQGQRMTFTLFNTFAPISHIGALQTIAQELDLDIIATVAEPYALARAGTTPVVLEMGGVFVDIGGGTTDVALVRDGTIEGMKMCALGGRAFTRRIMNEMSMGYDQAEQFKLSYSNGTAAQEQIRRAHEVMLPTAEVMAQGMALILEELTGDTPPPERIYIAGGGAVLPDVLEQFEAIDWKEIAPYAYAPKFTIMAPEMLSGMYDTTGILVNSQDITPMALALHGMTVQEGDSAEDAPMGAIMQRVLKAMKV